MSARRPPADGPTPARYTREEVRNGILVGLGAWVVGTFYFLGNVPVGGPLASLAIATGMALVLAIAAGAAFAGTMADRRRRKDEWDREARRRGWVHVAGDGGMAKAIAASSLPLRGWSTKRLLHTFHGRRDGVPFFVALTEGREGKAVQPFVIVGVAMPIAGDLSIQEETARHRVREAFGSVDIDFESEEFSRRFWVRGSDRRRAYEVLHPRAMEFFLKRGTKATWHWNDRTLVVGWAGTMRADEAARFLQEAWDFRALLPRHLLAWERVPAPAGPAPRTAATSASRRS